ISAAVIPSDRASKPPARATSAVRSPTQSARRGRPANRLAAMAPASEVTITAAKSHSGRVTGGNSARTRRGSTTRAPAACHAAASRPACGWGRVIRTAGRGGVGARVLLRKDCAAGGRMLPATGTPPQAASMTHPLTFLGIESSCDDTAAAVVRAGEAGGEILSSGVQGQAALHADFGGVVPEIAARAHVERLDGCVVQALEQAGVRLADLDGIAVTAGPGLIGGVLSGLMTAKALAAATGLPMVGVNHLAGHALTPRLTDGLAFPYLMLLVSGGHCQFLAVEGPETFRRLGSTIDDAPGEAFDKIAKLLGLPQPGGPHVEREAAEGDPRRFAFPRP